MRFGLVRARQGGQPAQRRDAAGIEDAVSAATVHWKEGEVRWCGRYGDKRPRGRREQEKDVYPGRGGRSGLGQGACGTAHLRGLPRRELDQERGRSAGEGREAFEVERRDKGRVNESRQSPFNLKRVCRVESSRSLCARARPGAAATEFWGCFWSHRGAVEHPPLVHDEQAGGNRWCSLLLFASEVDDVSASIWLFLTIISRFGFDFILAHNLAVINAVKVMKYFLPRFKAPEISLMEPLVAEYSDEEPDTDAQGASGEVYEASPLRVLDTYRSSRWRSSERKTNQVRARQKLKQKQIPKSQSPLSAAQTLRRTASDFGLDVAIPEDSAPISEI
ncbi:hypothetical protein B0H16DRAFT_1473688 [Mycena metata]|uniref:Uncharacterized protein n=1 Tax=Mycena metata TaxID=1033252 RepID=A0AAD7HIY2_9AGAR|nr:hypothetical protein B0H16DRAFT_1473688 [Mycena metata]